MAGRNRYGNFSQARARLDQIVAEVRDSELSLEKSLDLYEEAVALGNRCAELIDKSDYTEAEELAAREVLEAQAPDVSISGQQEVGAQDAQGAAGGPDATGDAGTKTDMPDASGAEGNADSAGSGAGGAS